MKHKLTGMAASMGALLIAATACSGGATGDGPPLDAGNEGDDGSSTANAAYVLRDWEEPCETFDFDELAEWFDYAEYRGDGKINSPYGVGLDQPAVMCQTLINYTKWTNDRGHERTGDGMLLVAVVPWEDAETAATDFADRVQVRKDSLGNATESELPGAWDEGVYLRDEDDTGDAWELLARDGAYILWVYVEIGPDPAHDEGDPSYSWTNDEVTDYLINSYFPQEHKLVEDALQEAGVKNE
ncbi:hypothetical protein L0U85_00660 [Glycomyces sp. L485]|uniref:hypothetical protein n=1 Tax=Glycomyces sp. L485 TaxID=2909235 RepID=UPI001F4A6D19|nr:hypothetical protein [Glycomyces sp. L485]MCH7229380.1 hypothetical protein [Glycomyces sp. L485]